MIRPFNISTDKQKRQRKLAWALKICMGFRGSIHMIPDEVVTKKTLKLFMDEAIKDIRNRLKLL